jgi:hypothetical protein
MRFLVRNFIGTMSVAAAVFVSVTVLSAGAASGSGSTNTIRAGATTSAPSTTLTESPLAGYAVTMNAVTSDATTFTVPTISCRKRVEAFQAAALLEDVNQGVRSGAALGIGCVKETEYLGALLDLDNSVTITTATVNGGDTVDFSATCGSGGESVSIDDTTDSTTVSESSDTANDCSVALIGDLAVAKIAHPASFYRLPPFDSISWTGVMVNGGAIGSLTPTAVNYNEGKRNVITTGALTAGGTAFVTTKGP